MTTDQVRKGFACQSTPSGEVRLYFTENGSPIAQIDMPAGQIGDIAAALLAAAKEATRTSGSKPTPEQLDQALIGSGALIPSGIRVIANPPPEPHGLVVEAGAAQIVVSLSKKWMSELGRALVAASASEDRSH